MLGDKNDFSGEGPAPSTTPSLDAYGTLPSPYWNPKYATGNVRLKR